MADYKIVKLVCENFKKLKMVEIDIQGNVIVIKGENEQGKSSVIDAIWVALTGKEIPPDPIAKGEDRAEIKVDISDGDITYTVKKVFKPTGHSLVVETESQRIKSPQAFLDKTLGNISFDPFEFLRLRPLEQKRLLQDFIGVDFTELDANKKQFNEGIRDLKAKKEILEAQLVEQRKKYEELTLELNKLIKENKFVEEAKDDDIQKEINSHLVIKSDISSLESKLENCRKEYRDVNTKITDYDNNKTKLKEHIDSLKQQIKEAEKDIKSIDKKKSDLKDSLPEVKKAGDDLVKKINEKKEKMSSVSVEELFEKQKKIRYKKELSEKMETIKHDGKSKSSEINAITKEQEKLRKQVKDIETERINLLKSKSLDIEGMEIVDDGVLFDGLKLDTTQLSTSQIIKIGMKLSMVLNSNLKILRIKDWNEIDKNNRKLIVDICKEKGYQLFVEEVADGKLGFEIT